jgi:hypothetical protein
MQRTSSIFTLGIVGALAIVGCGADQGQQASADMTFFVTSVGTGRGADLGVLEGADQRCARLA